MQQRDRHSVQRNRAKLERAEKPRDVTCAQEPRDATRYRETARCHVVQRDRATSRRAEGPRDTTAYRETARRYSVQRDLRDATACTETARVMPCRAEGPLDAKCCGETVRCYVVQRPRDATLCRGTARRCNVQINRAMPETARRYSMQRKVVQTEVVLRP